MLQIYNTLSRKKEEFQLAGNKSVRMYVCGPTVYARGHIGNFRTFVCLDVLRRVILNICGYSIKEVINFTDVDDKTIAGASDEGLSLREYTDQHIKDFKSDWLALGIQPVEETPRATDNENMKAMGNLVKELERKGHTYQSEGSIYFKIATQSEYGKLARLDKKGMKPGVRIDLDEYKKEDVRDFVLWKPAKAGEPSWDVGFGPGRPGWHLECSAMALRLLGEPPIDIHAGGVDLIFPHHENEITQSEAATGKLFSRFWIHVEHLFVEGKKMSKSAGNVFTLPEIVSKGYRPSALRCLLLSSHYRKQLNFTWAGIEQAEESLRRLIDFLARLDEITSIKEAGESRVKEKVENVRNKFFSALSNDLNTAEGLGAIFDFVRDVNVLLDSGPLIKTDLVAIRKAMDDFDQVLGVIGLRKQEDLKLDTPVEEIDRLIENREQARKRRDFLTADKIRKDLLSRGIVLEDVTGRTRWKQR